MANSYVAGQVVQVTAVFTTVATGAVVDPGTIAFKYAITVNGVTGATTTLTYSGASTPAVGVVARTSAGTYVAQVDTTSKPGYWQIEWVSTGTGQTTQPSDFLVSAAPL